MVLFRKAFVVCSVALAVGATPVIAGEHHHGAQHASVAKITLSKAAREQKKAHDAMHKAMMSVRNTGDPDTDFVIGMIPHHQGAVDMANVVLKYGKDKAVRELAEWIIKTQKVEIALMKRWFATAGARGKVERVGGKETIEAFDHIMDAMHRDMNIKYTNHADVDFVVGMIPHHQGAIDMAEVLIEHGTDPELRQLSRDIIRSQRQEIALMKDWLSSHSTKRGK